VKIPLAAIASAILFASAPAFAQTAAQATPAAPVASADPAVVAATRQMLAAMNVRDAMRSMLSSMERQMPAQMRASALAAINANPNLTPQQKAEQLKKLDAEVAAGSAQMHTVFSDPTLIDDMIAETVPLYAETYTLDEIRQLTAFYTSPLGQKMQANIPVLMARSFEISQRVLTPRIQKAMVQNQQTTGK